MITLPARIDLMKLLPPGSTVAEVGCWKAYFATEVLNNCPNIRQLFCVDSWTKQLGYHDPLSDADHEANLREAKRHLRGHLPSGRAVIVRGSSLDVAANDKTIPPLTAAYIDADHSFEACFNDLVAWSKRLKPGGWLMGHDFTNNSQAQKWNFGVIPAVEKFCAEHGWKMTHITNEDFASYVLQKA